MNTENQNEVFEFTYSAKQQEEVQKIREKYVPKEADKMEQLRRLDANVTKKGTVVSLVVGIVSALILGVGMCCCMVWGGALFIPGIIKPDHSLATYNNHSLFLERMQPRNLNVCFQIVRIFKIGKHIVTNVFLEKICPM